MGLFDFLKKGEQTPAPTPAARPAAATSTPDFLGQSAAAKAPATDKYTVKSGDSLSKIAKAHYGDAMKWKALYEANKGLIGENPDMIQPGQELTLPKL